MWLLIIFLTRKSSKAIVWFSRITLVDNLFKKSLRWFAIFSCSFATLILALFLLKLPKIGLVRVKKHRDFDGLIKSVTVSKNPSGKYYVSVLVEQEEKEKLPTTDSKIGIDLGIKEFCITSDGEMVENPKYLRKSEKRLRKLQKDLSRCKKGSNNRNKVRIKVAKKHEKTANQRKDFFMKL